jgi:DNA phosphorothioation-associated putative methyltransferase
VGSVKRALRIIAKATGPETWARIREERTQDLLVYLALAKFGGRPPLSKLPRSLRLDIRGLLSTYKKACAQADALLFSAGNRQMVDEACRASQVGKLTPSVLYIRQAALESLAPVLRIYEGCARVVVGSVEGANIIKLDRDAPVVSYLQYHQFEDDPHPALQGPPSGRSDKRQGEIPGLLGVGESANPS